MKNRIFSLVKIFSLTLFVGLAISSCKKVEDPIIQPPEGGDLTTVTEIDETFDGTKYDVVEIEGWNNIAMVGTQAYIYNEFSGNTYANMSVYKATEARESWLITPRLDVEKATFKYVVFDTRADHVEGATFEVFASKDYDGGEDLTKYTWTKLDVPLSTSTADGYGRWVSSDIVDLSDIGNCVIAFKYTGTPDTNKGGFSVDNFKFNKESGSAGGEITTVTEIDEAFDGTKYGDVLIDGWFNIAVQGDQPYIYNEYNNNTYANMSVYKATEARESWLITPILDIANAANKTVSFDTRADHLEGATFEVFTSKDYDGGTDVSKYTWNKLDVKISTSSADGYGEWLNTGVVDLSSIGNCVVAFKYVGDPSTKKGGFSIDNFKFNKEGGTTEEGTGTGTLADPYDILNAKANQGDKDNMNMLWTKGYIVGYIETEEGNANKGKFVVGVSDHVNTNIVIAESADETDATKAVAVQLPYGFIREALNLVDNAGKIKTQVWLKGSLEAYFGMPGIKSLEAYSLDGSTEETAPITGTIGEGTPIAASDLTNTTIDFTVWNVLQSEAIWTASSGAASINAYGKGAAESWMISKNKVDFTGVADARLFVSETINYFSKFDDIQVLISTDYSGTGDPTSASWTVLSVDGTRAQNGDIITQFVATGTGYIAFKYSASVSKASSWSVKTVEVKTKEDNGGGDPTPDPSTLANGSFEKWTSDTAPENWKGSDISKGTEKQEGSYSVKLDGKTKVTQDVTLKAGDNYDISFWYFIEKGKARMYSKFLNADGATTGMDLIAGDDYLTETGKWIQFTASFTVPADAKGVRVDLRSYEATKGDGATVYYDNVTLTKK